MQHTIELSHHTDRHGRETVRSATWKLGPNPYRLYSRDELPKWYEFDDWETEEDTYIKHGRQYYNLREFTTIGMPRLPGPRGGAQLAAGLFMIAGFEGEIYPVSEEMHERFA